MSNQVVLQKKTVMKNGGASYTREGVRASVYCSPKNFDGAPPDTITIAADNLVVPETKK
jgi:hypothetical protein